MCLTYLMMLFLLNVNITTLPRSNVVSAHCWPVIIMMHLMQFCCMESDAFLKVLLVVFVNFGLKYYIDIDPYKWQPDNRVT